MRGAGCASGSKGRKKGDDDAEMDETRKERGGGSNVLEGEQRGAERWVMPGLGEG